MTECQGLWLDFQATCGYNGHTGNALDGSRFQGSSQADAIGLMEHSIAQLGRSRQPAVAGE